MKPIKILFFLLLSASVSGCAINTKQKIQVWQQPTNLNRTIKISGGNASERLNVAKVECKKLSELFEPVSSLSKTLNPTAQFDQFVCDPLPQPKLTAIQLKALQTRLFKTSADNLANAVETYIKDENGICSKNNRVVPSPYGLAVGGSHLSSGEIECRTRFMQFNSTFSNTKDGTVMRTRIYVYAMVQPSIQLTQPEEYHFFFKKIADQLFIEAIQLNPVEMM